jgi:hypothetical protein
MLHDAGKVVAPGRARHPSGVKIRSREKSAKGRPLTRDTMIAARL